MNLNLLRNPLSKIIKNNHRKLKSPIYPNLFDKQVLKSIG